MALIVCTHCGKQMSDLAEVCPHCGVVTEAEKGRNKKTREVRYRNTSIFLSCIFLCFTLLYCCVNDPTNFLFTPVIIDLLVSIGVLCICYKNKYGVPRFVALLCNLILLYNIICCGLWFWSALYVGPGPWI